MKLLNIFFLSLFCTAPICALADCVSPKMDTCLKMKVVSSKKNWLFSFIKFKSLCNVEFSEIASDKKWQALLVGCPEVTGERYVFLKYKCDDTAIVPVPASLLLMDDQNCASILDQRLKKYNDFSQIKAGLKLSELHKYGLKKVELGNSNKIWKYYAEPGYIV